MKSKSARATKSPAASAFIKTRRIFVRLLTFTIIICILSLFWNVTSYGSITSKKYPEALWTETQRILKETFSEDISSVFSEVNEINGSLIVNMSLSALSHKHVGTTSKIVAKKNISFSGKKEKWPRMSNKLFKRLRKIDFGKCWRRTIPRKERSNSVGFVNLTCEGHVEQQRVQIAEAIVYAYQIGAHFLIPTIKEASWQPTSTFPELYSVPQLIKSFPHILSIAPPHSLPPPSSTQPQPLPPGLSSLLIDTEHKPNLQNASDVVNVIVTSLNYSLDPFSVALNSSLAPETTPSSASNISDPLVALRCLATYSSLGPGPEVDRLANRVLDRIREAAVATGGKFVAIDLDVSGDRSSECAVMSQQDGRGLNGSALSQEQQRFNARCPMSASDVALLLKALGFGRRTALYLTASRWSTDLKPLEDAFPVVLTKEYSVPLLEELQSTTDKSVMDTLIDFHVCSEADFFLPAIPKSPFEKSVIGQRIFSGKGNILQAASLSLYNMSTVKEEDSKKFPILRAMYRRKRRLFMDNLPLFFVAEGLPSVSCLCEGVWRKRRGSKCKRLSHKQRQQGLIPSPSIQNSSHIEMGKPSNSSAAGRGGE